jgi:hypothetical protein
VIDEVVRESCEKRDNIRKKGRKAWCFMTSYCGRVAMITL